ncbi:lysophospholipid acyltransferase family protein [Pelagibaculum spongiae]|uniref:1-acyl-sn-glycerol-3-phosphate acyltransferase n=1 Tax=Pelagibaculum spongiae TaxID=2080658 RepID=A0A2V1GS50_9GAMM|nr:lysophospholipid acyltransferase family protein [Pelagibaculum spongiae]PVZ68219.1 1-acyl-sn-glycerol-3-phosphate acyltransferase [Pelagibaculum spongiae]
MSRYQKPLTPLVIVRTLVFHCWLVLSAVFWLLPGVLIGALLPYRPRYRLVSSWCWLVVWGGHFICGMRYQVEGKENIDPEKSAVIISKHQSAWETIAFPTIFSYQTWVLKRELMKIPVFGWALKIIKPIAIDRSRKTSSRDYVMQQGKARLDEGINVVIFPEGTRVPVGYKRRYASGASSLAIDTGYSILPVALNAGECWPNSFWKYPGTIKVKIGKPVTTENRDIRQLNEQIELWIEQESLKMSGLEYPAPQIK